MPLTPGTRIGPYEIIAPLGAGGMGEVYRARDPRLGRDVAIKILPAAFSADADRLRRFEQEARAAATLSHPNILAVYDVGTDNGVPYLVTELLDGETLRERLAPAAAAASESVRDAGVPLPVRRSVEYALQIAQGLAAAHDKGIVHRDLKPENVFITKDARAKILDFGLAKALGASSADAGTVAATAGTDVGQILGTIGYMAPEQVRGLSVDHRADVFAFGCLLYEMLGGRRAFGGATPADTMSAILTSDPPDLDVETTIPPALVRIVRRCLEKSPALRFQSAQDLAFAIENLSGTSPSIAGPARDAPDRPSRSRFTATAVAMLTAGLAIGAVAATLMWRSGRGDTIDLGRTMAVTHEDGVELHPALSPDGSLVAYAAGPSDGMHIYVRQIAGGRAIDLTASMPGSHGHPRWSPDGTRVLFVSPGGVEVVPALGGAAKRVVDHAVSADWSPDGKEIAYVTDDGRVYARALDGSAPRTVTETREPHSLSWSPDGRFLAFVSGNLAFTGPGRLVGNRAPSQIMVVAAGGGTAVPATTANVLNTSPAWTADSRHVLFVSSAHGTRDVFEVALTAEGRPAGDARRLTIGLNVHTVALSRDGHRLVYATLSHWSNIWSIRIPDRPPISIREATPVTSGHQVIEGLSLSLDRQWIAFDSDLSGNQDIYRMHIPDGEPEQVTSDPADEFEPAWSPDGNSIAFHGWSSGNRDVYVIGADGHGRQRLTSDPGHEWFPAWSPDGSKIAFADLNRNGASVVQRTGSGWSGPTLIAEDGAIPAFSPDGLTLLLMTPFGPNMSLARGLGQVRTAPAAGGQARVLWQGAAAGTTAFPAFARWSRDGRLIYVTTVDQEGHSSIWSMPSTGGGPTLIIRFDDPTRESNRAEFDTDGERLYFTLARKEGDVWVMEVGSGGLKP